MEKNQCEISSDRPGSLDGPSRTIYVHNIIFPLRKNGEVSHAVLSFTFLNPQMQFSASADNKSDIVNLKSVKQRYKNVVIVIVVVLVVIILIIVAMINLNDLMNKTTQLLE